MAKFSLSRPDTQARVAVVLSLISCGTLAAVVVLILPHFDSSQWGFIYGRSRGLLIQGVTAATLLLAAAGFGMGLNSVGQRRNDKPTLSWIGFFVGGAVICLALVLFIFFRMRGELWTM